MFDWCSALKAQKKEAIAALLQDPKLNVSIPDCNERTVFGVTLDIKDRESAKAILVKCPHAAEETNSLGTNFGKFYPLSLSLH